MSQRYSYEVWQYCILELELVLEESKNSASDKDGLAKIYLRYLQVLRKLNDVYCYIRQPQQREAVEATLVCCIGLTVESWFALVAANQGIDVIDFSKQLLELRLTPSDLDVPISEVLKKAVIPAHAKIRAALEAVPMIQSAPSAANSSNTNPEVQNAAVLYGTQPSKATVTAPRSINKSVGGPESKIELTQEAAAIKIQAAWKGFKDRKRFDAAQMEEYIYLGLLGLTETATGVAANTSEVASAVGRRERRQAEYVAAQKEVESLLQAQEAPFMAVEERLKVYSWLEERIDQNSGRWPEVPLTGDLSADDEEVSNSAPGNALKSPSGKTPQGSRGLSAAAKPEQSKSPKPQKSGAPSPATKPSVERSNTTEFSYTTEMEKLIEDWKKVWAEKQPAEIDTGLPCGCTKLAGSSSGSEDIQKEDSALQGLPRPRRGSSIDAVELNLVAAAVRPKVQEQVRRAVREQAQQTAAAANAALPAQRTAPLQKSDKGNINAAKLGKTSNLSEEKRSKQPSTGEDNRAKEKRKEEPPQQQQSIEEILHELAALKILRPCPQVPMSAFLGECSFLPTEASAVEAPAPVKKVKSGGKAANVAAKSAEPLLPYLDLSLAQVRQLLTLECVLPLAAFRRSASCHLPVRPVTALIYGPSGSGKTMLAESIAHESRSALFVLSAAALTPEKSADSLVQAVFAAAKASAPAVIYIDKVEQIFIKDQKRAAIMADADSGELPCRLRKQLVAETAKLTPADGVLVLCTSAEPQSCVGADETEFTSFFQLLVKVPLPDEFSRRLLLASFAGVEGVQWTEGKKSFSWQQLGLVSRLTAGFTAFQLKKMVERAAEAWKMHQREPEQRNLVFIDYFLEAAASEAKCDEAQLTALAEWTARAHAVKKGELQGETPAATGKASSSVAKGKPSKSS